MEATYKYNNPDRISLEDLHWFYAKSKVPICLAITEAHTFLNRFTKAGVLSEEESLELQGDTRSVHRVIYECLCRIDEKNIPLDIFFLNLFEKNFLKIYPKLNPIYKEYKEGKFKNCMQSSPDREKDEIIFAQDKVKICLAVTDIFPFIHGLQDLTVLSDVESLKLQADGRPVSRVIYECLSLIEKKDLKLSVVFEYIFQDCYQNLYPGLRTILEESDVDQDGPFNGKDHLVFNKPGGLLEFFEQNKSDISAAINESFPFLNGLSDVGLLPRLEVLKLQADKRPPKDVLYDTLSLIQGSRGMEAFFSHIFREYYLSRFPALQTIVQRLNRALMLDMRLPIPDKEDIIIKHTRKCKTKPISYTEFPDYNQELMNSKKKRGDKEDIMIQKTRKCKTKPIRSIEFPDNNGELMNKKTKHEDEEDIINQHTRKCKTKPICYTEFPDYDWDLLEEKKCEAWNSPVCSTGKVGLKTSVRKNWKNRQHTKPKVHIHRNGILSGRKDKGRGRGLSSGAQNVQVKLEFPKQVFNDEFLVRCGKKTGIFMKKFWKGDSKKDRCIKCDQKMFSVINFEKHGGRESWKSWKRSIRCSGILMEKLFEAGILKSPIKKKR